MLELLTTDIGQWLGGALAALIAAFGLFFVGKRKGWKNAERKAIKTKLERTERIDDVIHSDDHLPWRERLRNRSK